MLNVKQTEWKDSGSIFNRIDDTFTGGEGYVKDKGIWVTTKPSETTNPDFEPYAFIVDLKSSTNKNLDLHLPRLTDGTYKFYIENLNTGVRTTSFTSQRLSITMVANVPYRLMLEGDIENQNPDPNSQDVYFDWNEEVSEIVYISNERWKLKNYPRMQSSVLVEVPGNLPPAITSLKEAFAGCRVFIGSLIGSWDTQNVVTLEGTFNDTSVFNTLLPWNTTNVENMSLTFSNTKMFNRPLNWVTSKVKNMLGMFLIAEKFNQPLAHLDVGNVENMESMFFMASSYKQPITSWNVAKVTHWGGFYHNSGLSSDDVPDKFR